MSPTPYIIENAYKDICSMWAYVEECLCDPRQEIQHQAELTKKNIDAAHFSLHRIDALSPEDMWKRCAPESFVRRCMQQTLYEIFADDKKAPAHRLEAISEFAEFFMPRPAETPVVGAIPQPA